MTTNYVRDELLRTSSTERRALSASAIRKANNDPSNEDVLTRVLWAVHCMIVDLEQEENELFQRL